MILLDLPWAQISPTLHKLLAHASTLITEFDEGRGLEAVSEEGIDACNKQVRRCRTSFTKFSYEENVHDIFMRLISQSDHILLLNRKILEKQPNNSTSELKSIQDRLVNSFFLDDKN